MPISDHEVRSVAALARLAIDDDTIPRYAAELSAILDFVGQMNAADTRNVPPLAHPLELDARLRADCVSEGDQRERLLALAPATANGLFVVPKVID
jgi:aspartyl-tRNA(Asn)/glutamyl-tRNA(Gln) amidotransferase subunit C